MSSGRMFALMSLLAAGSAQAADDWAKYKGDCDNVLKAHETVIVERLKECTGLWIAYVDPNVIRPAEKQGLKDAFQTLYDKGVNKSDDEAQYLATSAAERLDVRLQLKLKHDDGGEPTAKSSKTKPGEDDGGGSASGRKRFEAPDVSDAARKKAAGLVKDGLALRGKKKNAKALEAYEKALELDPGNMKGLYNAACELALKGQKKESVEYLQRLVDIGTKESLALVKSARVDQDFEPVHDYVPFKKVTGYAKIKVVNSLGEYGEDEVERIAKTLEKLKYPIADKGDDKTKNRPTPVIFFKDHSAPTAYVIKEVVIHPGTVVTKITWETEYDVIVSWGNKLVVKDGVKAPAKDYTDVSPDQAEKQLDKLGQAEDTALRKPQEVSRKIDHTIDTPKRVGDKVEGGVDKVEKTVETLEKTGDKIKGIFK